VDAAQPAEQGRQGGRRVRPADADEAPGQPEEIAPAYVFLASNADSSFMTGEVIALMGGETTAG
jgi:NAD(P)-dependent dehydrogenase (short-subunit alcohol dehydrogenase family)